MVGEIVVCTLICVVMLMFGVMVYEDFYSSFECESYDCGLMNGTAGYWDSINYSFSNDSARERHEMCCLVNQSLA